MPRKALANAPAALWFASRRAANFEGRHLVETTRRTIHKSESQLHESRFVKRRVPSIRSKKLRPTETTGNH